MKKLYEFFHLLMAIDGPIDFKGKCYHFNKTSIGAANPYRRASGARKVDLSSLIMWRTTTNGLVAAATLVRTNAEKATEVIVQVRVKSAPTYGRDWSQFHFTKWCPILIHEEPNEIERKLGNNLIKYMTVVISRIHILYREREKMAMPTPVD